MDVRLMGSVVIHDGTRSFPLPRAGERCVLASLALEPGRRLHIDTLVDRVWGDDSPTGAGHTIASYIRSVRKAIGDAGGRRDWLRNHRPARYELNLDPSLVDYHRFTALVAQARSSQRDGSPVDAILLLEEALQLRTGAALGDVTGQWAASRGYAIEQEYQDVICALYEQQLAIGTHAAVATHATNLVMDVVPTDRMIVLAIHGLARSGQHAAISGFLNRATQRMWDTAQARPSPQVVALARRLIATPEAPLPPPPTAPAGAPPPDQPTDDGPQDTDPASPSSVDGNAVSPHGPVRDGQIVMIAEGNQRVNQAARDQYIIEN